MAEQLVYLLLTIAQGLTFISFAVAILFAFFKRLEVIARSIIDLWIELIIQTIVIALIQALVVTFFLAGTASGNGIVVLGVGLICLIFMVIVLISAVKAVWSAFNRLFNAFGQATGGAIISPGTAAAATAAAGIGAVGLAAGTALGVSSGALAGMTALQSGATPAQAAGLALGGVQPLSDAARTLTRLPSLRNTPLGDAAEQFTEGAVTRRVVSEVPLGRALGPLLGGRLLTDFDPGSADLDENGRVVGRPMLVPAVGERLEALTYPLGKRPKRKVNEDPSEWMEDEDGELLPGYAPVWRQRYGTFTPGAPDGELARERQTYADDMRGEEMEAHLSDVVQSGAGKATGKAGIDSVESAAGRLERAADALTGSLRISGNRDISGVLGDVMRLLGGRGANGVDHPVVAGLLAQAVGVTPAADGRPPVREDLARFGLFVDSAARLGLTPEQTERVSREVNASPDRTLPDALRGALLDGAMAAGRSREEASRAVGQLEIAARLLPGTLTVVGSIPAPTTEPKENDAMAGSGQIIQGGA